MLAQIRSFLAVAEEGSLHRAAARLRMSQPALSRQMQVLENELGGRLFDRTSTGVQLTAGGHALVKKMGTVLAAYDGAMVEVRRLVRGENDDLRIGYLASAAREYLDPALKRVRKGHPETKLKLLDLTPGEQIAAFREGTLDVGLTDESGQLLSRDFYTRKLASVPSVVALPEQHLLAEQKEVRLAQLKNETFVNGSDEHVPGISRRLVSYCRHYGKFRPKFTGSANTIAESLEMVANDNAVSILPVFLRYQEVPGVVIRPIAETDVTWDILVVWRRGKVGGALRTLLEGLLDNKVRGAKP